nr:unnamed protein product [African swine fever virus]
MEAGYAEIAAVQFNIAGDNDHKRQGVMEVTISNLFEGTLPAEGVFMMREWEPPITIINASPAHTSASNVWDTQEYCRCMLRFFNRSSSPKYDDG